MAILTGERLLKKGLSHVAALACAAMVADDYKPLLAGERATAYAFFLRGEDGRYHATVAFSKEEAADLLEAQPGAVVLPLHKLAEEFLAEIVEAQKGLAW